MNIIKRFFDELAHPEKKCKRVGHREDIQTSIWMVQPWKAEELDKEYWSFRDAGVRMRKSVKRCSRCGVELAVGWKAIQGFQSVSMSSDHHDQFCENGMVEVS